MAPCIGNQTREDYHRIVKQVRQFLEGRDRELLDDMRGQMETAADREEYEEAARLRDRIFKIERTLEKQRITRRPPPIKMSWALRDKARRLIFNCCSSEAGY